MTSTIMTNAVRSAIFALAAVLYCLPGAVLAGGFVDQVRGGVLAHDVDDLWSGKRRESGVDINVEAVLAKPSVALPAGHLRPNVGLSVNTAGDTSKIYAGVVWEFQHHSGMFFDIGVGAALHNGELDTRRRDAKSLGSRVLFRIPVELGYSPDGHHRFSVMFAHVSNGYLAEPNEGLDTLGLRYGYRF